MIKWILQLCWSAGGILSSLFSISNSIFDFCYLWWFENALLWYHSRYCQGVSTTFYSIIIYETICIGSCTYTPYWLGSSRTYTPQRWLWRKCSIDTLFPDTFRTLYDKLSRIHHTEHSSWVVRHWGSIREASGICWKTQSSRQVKLTFWTKIESCILLEYLLILGLVLYFFHQFFGI